MRVVTGVSENGQINGTYSKISMVAAAFQPPTNHSDDVAFVFFIPEVTFNDYVKPVCLPRQHQPPPKSPCALTGISKVQLKETLLLARRMKGYSFGGNQYFRIKDTFDKTGKTHLVGSPLVCRHNGLWTLYGINVPGLAKKRRSTFIELYDKLNSIQDEVQLPVGSNTTHSTSIEHLE
ncbi:Trypsin domain containing protein [Trichuris trichiura]|uniref:Trypsin domain containing protein n=1 Tax=Trichuris trichiura TaxID=36087 RepID=A0A077Z644_TRITR|nr:Trypsin domain containing protein [Trichuris trichiura]